MFKVLIKIINIKQLIYEKYHPLKSVQIQKSKNEALRKIEMKKFSVVFKLTITGGLEASCLASTTSTNVIKILIRISIRNRIRNFSKNGTESGINSPDPQHSWKSLLRKAVSEPTNR
jgi:Trk K+ transport system NAD-binding subunit